MNTPCEKSDLLVFSHLRWDFVYHRPQHLLSRHAKYRRVFYFEEPVTGMTDNPRLHLRETSEGVQVVVPYLPSDVKPHEMEAALRELVDDLILEENISDFTLWYYTPMALSFSRHLKPVATIFDYMEEPSQNMHQMESELLKKADVVFTAGPSLYEAKKHAHHNIHSFPSSIDYAHFSQGRLQLVEPDDQVHIPHPRIGFYGVIDDRFDIVLLSRMAELKPEYQFIIIGPHTKIDSSVLPQRANIHYLGKKDYHALPLYLSGWDCAMMPFVLNDTTRYTNPTKTPEFLAAGKPVVSTAIQDVVHQYKTKNLIHIAASPEEFLLKIELAMNERTSDPEWLDKVDWFLADNSWDITFEKMARHETAFIKKLNSRRDINLHESSIPIVDSKKNIQYFDWT